MKKIGLINNCLDIKNNNLLSLPLLGKPLIEYNISLLNEYVSDLFCLLNNFNLSLFSIYNHINVDDNNYDINFFNELGYTLFINANLLFMEKNIIDNIINIHLSNNYEITIGVFNNDKFYCIDNKLLFNLLSKHGVKVLNNINNYIDGCNKKYLEFDSKSVIINDLLSLNRIEDKLRNYINLKHLENGVYVVDINSTYISYDTVISPGSIIYPNTFIYGKSVIGKSVKIGPNCEIFNSVLKDNVICKYSVIFDSEIGDFARVGPFAHIRMNSIIGNNDRIGNFVEVKNSVLGHDTKSAHLTYIGDTICGNMVNFGCSSIIVNFDGKVKSKTIIGDDVFLGCNSNLVAPITISNNTYIAAGSTVTSNTLDGDFVIARSRPVVKRSYAYKYKKGAR